MTTDTLRNGMLQIAVKRDGAELASIVDAHGVEYLWQGNPLIWNGQSPLLFPIVGKLAGDTYSCASAIYTLPQHGFARRRQFDLVERNEARMSYSLRSDAATREVYPFEFKLTLTYTLEGSSVRIGYRVTNLDSRPLPFSIGGHPAFSCSRGPGDNLEDYYLEFEQPESADTCLVRNGLLALKETKRMLDGERTLQLSNTLFDDGALVFMNLASSAVTLRSRRHPAQVRVDFPGFPCLGIWSKPAAPFVCIEPWFGHADPEGRPSGSDIESKPAILILEPRLSFKCEWRASIIPQKADGSPKDGSIRPNSPARACHPGEAP